MNIYLSRDESNAFKGLLILLIILGHNFMLANASFDGVIFSWVYKFHVACFFIIPFFYSREGKTISAWRNLKANMVRLGVPYLMFYVLSYTLFQGGVYHSIGGIRLFVSGLLQVVQEDTWAAAGVRFLWFPPVFIGFCLLRDLYDSHKVVRLPLLLLSCLVFVLSSLKLYDELGMPNLLLLSCFSYFFLGWLSHLILKREYSGLYVALALVFACLSFAALFLGFKGNVAVVYPMSFMAVLLTLRKRLSSLRLLKSIGVYSFQIYMVHFYVNYAFELLLPCNLVDGLLSYAATVAISYLMIYALQKWKPVYSLVFPSGKRG